MNNTLTTTKTFWGIVTLGLWVISGILVITKTIDYATFIGSLTTTLAIGFGGYQMYNKNEALETVDEQSILIDQQSNEIHRLHIDNSKLQAQTKILNTKLNETEPDKNPETKQTESNKKPRKQSRKY